jgi:hypothetical protein
MRQIFNGWRRKAGTGLLACGLLVLVAWCRSHAQYDEVWFPVGRKNCELISGGGFVTVRIWRNSPPEWRWISSSVQPARHGNKFPPDADLPWETPYRAPALSFAAFSAYLILWPRRMQPATPKNSLHSDKQPNQDCSS